MQHQSHDFETHRGHVFGVAYRMLGSAADADDITQEAWLRYRSQGPLENPRAWLTTVATRLSIDRLRELKARRETYPGPWLPEPIVEGPAVDRPSLEESLTQAFLVLLESLTPQERAVYLLREVFAFEYDEIARVVEKTEANCRQLFSRARERLAARKPRFEAPPAQRQGLAREFLRAVSTGDITALVARLRDDAVLVSDHGGKAVAAQRPILGAEAIARMLASLGARVTPEHSLREVVINGNPGISAWLGDTLETLMEFEFDGDRIATLRVWRNPDKLARVQRLLGGV